jgi:NADH dehydrogenase
MNEHNVLLITGATGYIGSRLTRRANDQGYIVKTLSRSHCGGIPPILAERRYFGSLPDQIPLKAFESVEVVIHCAAWTASGAAQAQRINVDGTIRLAELSLHMGVKNFIFLSSQSARPDALSDYGRSKYAAEQALLYKFAHTGLNIVILRPGLVTGHGDRGLYQRLCRMVDSWPILPLLEGGKSIVQPIHIDDLCDAIFRCCQIDGELGGKIFNLGHSHGTSLAQFIQAIALSRKGRRILAISIPIWPITIVVWMAERLGLPLPITSEHLKGLVKVEKMETETDMALLGIPVRSLDVIVRDHLDRDPSVLREASLISRYLLRITPSSELQYRYAEAIQRLKITLDRDEDRLWRIVKRYPKTLHMIDGALAFLKPQGGIRRRIYTMLAILEASSEHCERFLPKPCSSFQMIRIIGIGLRAGLITLLGLLFIQMLKVKWNCDT